VSGVSVSNPGAVTWSVEPDKSVTLKFAAFTVIDSIAALEPETLSVMPFTLKTVSVVSVTSLYAANANAGASSATRIPAPLSIRGIVTFN
jgi:hypothetical protein